MEVQPCAAPSVPRVHNANEFAQDEVGEEAKSQCRAFGRATPSLRPSIDLLYDIEQIINPSRLTKALDQFG